MQLLTIAALASLAAPALSAVVYETEIETVTTTVFVPEGAPVAAAAATAAPLVAAEVNVNSGHKSSSSSSSSSSSPAASSSSPAVAVVAAAAAPSHSSNSHAASKPTTTAAAASTPAASPSSGSGSSSSGSIVTLPGAPRAYIYNGCDFDVNVWSVVVGDAGTKVSIPKNGGTYNESYRTPSIGGVSLKLTPEDTCDTPTPITQFEYTYEGGRIWYDLSDINCVGGGSSCPFKAYGMYMKSGSGCPTVSCTKGVQCAGAYNAWDDDRTSLVSLSCGGTDSIYLYLCMTQEPSAATKAKRHSHHFRRAHGHTI